MKPFCLPCVCLLRGREERRDHVLLEEAEQLAPVVDLARLPAHDGNEDLGGLELEHLVAEELAEAAEEVPNKAK